MPTTTSHNPSLIRTKLAPPRTGNAPVNRDALLQQLDERRDRKLTLVLGPAGCGKTTLLAQWRRNLLLLGAKVAWYNASPDDDDLHIAAYIVESLQQAQVSIDTEALHVFTRSGGKASAPLLRSLINDLVDHQGPVYLVIDDFHYVAAYSILQMLDRWLKLMPAGFHLVLGSRMRPPLQLGTLRAEDQLTEVRFTDLRFDQEETRRYLVGQGLTQLNSAQVRALHEITDGWVAGLQLLAFSLRKYKTPELFFQQQGKLSLSQAEALHEYLERATVEHLTEAELGFLTRISACRRFNRELCEVLTGDPRAARHLAKFESENLFLIPIDTTDTEPWYRFHRLFASFLHERLQRHADTELKKLHQLASHWFASKALHAEAMRHAKMAGDSDFLADLIDRAARRMINGAQFVEYLGWCDSVPRDQLKMRLNASLCAAWAQLSCSRVEDFDRTIADVAVHPDHGKPEVEIEVQLLRAYRFLRQDDTAACLRIVEPMLRHSPRANTFQSLLIRNIASWALVYHNDFERAREVARSRHRYDIPQRPDYPKPLIDVIAGFSHLVQGNIKLASSLLTPFIEDALRSTRFGADAAGLFSGYLLEAYYQSGELPLARSFLERYFDLIDAVGVADGMLFAYRVRARLERMDGNVEAARQTLQRLEEIGYRHSLDRLVAWSLYEQLGLAIASPRGAIQRDLMQRLELLSERYRDQRDCAWSEIPLALALAQADVAFHQSPDSSSVALIDAADAAALASRRQLLSTKLGFMRAIARLHGDRRGAEAISAARSLVRSAAELGMMRVLPDLGSLAVPLIESLLEGELDHAEREYLECCAKGIETSQVPLHPVGDVAVPAGAKGEVLSVREQEVLVLLSKALSVKGIARALSLSPGTVKWHLKNVYGKLNASSREDALAKARTLRIVR